MKISGTIGSPPRMRGKLYGVCFGSDGLRITPADAGKTFRGLEGSRLLRDHPRGCGENYTFAKRYAKSTGSPPRMRGKRFVCDRGISQERITPADAGKTGGFAAVPVPTTDHPRGCGENASVYSRCSADTGSPPRMRGKRHSDRMDRRRDGITPADAGKTNYQLPQDYIRQDHPRGCGENEDPSRVLQTSSGSPPRMRGKPL